MNMQNKIPQTNLKISKLEALRECKVVFLESLISAGFPSSAENFVESSLDLNDLVIKHQSSTYFIRVIGDSMEGAGIKTNDILIVDRSLSAANNKVVVVRINDEFLVKKLVIKEDKIFLFAENNKYKPIEITSEMDFEVWGVVTFVIHQV